MKTVEPVRARRMVAATVISLLAASALTAILMPTPANAARAEGAPPADPITVTVLTVNGSGCPAGTATATAAPDNTGFHIAYSSFIARDGGSSSPSEFRKNCQVAVQVKVPQGFTYAVAGADYRGRFLLSNGSTALERTNYYFQGDADNAYVDHNFTGPTSGAWHTSDSTDVAALEYAPCGRTVTVNVNTELRVYSPGPYNWMSLRTSDGDVDTLVHFSWKAC